MSICDWLNRLMEPTAQLEHTETLGENKKIGDEIDYVRNEIIELFQKMKNSC